VLLLKLLVNYWDWYRVFSLPENFQYLPHSTFIVILLITVLLQSLVPDIRMSDIRRPNVGFSSQAMQEGDALVLGQKIWNTLCEGITCKVIIKNCYCFENFFLILSQ